MNSGMTKDNENAAKALCASSKASYTYSVMVLLRSEDDPYVVAGNEAGCDYNFGPTAAQHFFLAQIFLWFGGLLASPFAIVCLSLGCKKIFNKKEPVSVLKNNDEDFAEIINDLRFRGGVFKTVRGESHI